MTVRALFEAKRPLYQVIAEALAAEIESGRIRAGELLPSEARLCAAHGVSRHTVREAIRALAGLGLVDARPGIGTRVLRARPGAYMQTLKEISDLDDYVAETSRRVVSRATIHAADAKVNLPGGPGKAWRMVEAVRHVAGTGTVVAWTQIFVLPRYGAVFDRLTGNDLVYRLIETGFGIRTAKVRQSLSALAAPDFAARHLGLPPGAPALAVLREYCDERDEIFEVAWSIHPPDRYRHRTEFVLSPGGGARPET